MFVALIVLWLLRPSDADVNYFINPPRWAGDSSYASNEVYRVGSTVKLQWVTNYTSIYLLVYQWQPDGPTVGTSLDNTSEGVPTFTSYTWEVNITSYDTFEFNLSQSNSGYLNNV